MKDSLNVKDLGNLIKTVINNQLSAVIWGQHISLIPIRKKNTSQIVHEFGNILESISDPQANYKRGSKIFSKNLISCFILATYFF